MAVRNEDLVATPIANKEPCWLHSALDSFGAIADVKKVLDEIKLSFGSIQALVGHFHLIECA